MESGSRITRVVLENFKSIAFCDVRLGPLTILVGPNGAGKSNFLDALRFLSQATAGPTSKAFHDRGGFFRVIRRGIKADANIGIRIEFVTNSVSGFFAARFCGRTRADYVIEHERCWLEKSPSVNGYEVRHGTVVSGQVPGANVVGLDQLHLPIAASQEVFKPVFDFLQGCHFYSFNPKDFRQPVASDITNTLAADGENLANVASRMSMQYPDEWRRVVEYLRVILPALDAVETVELGGYRTLEFVVSQGAESFAPREVSDGTLRSLAVLVALFQHRGGASGVQLVALEEPEGAVHPAAAGVLFDAMREASANVQVLAATHSADLLDKKDIDSDSILSVDLEGGTTSIGRLDQTGRQALKERLYTTGELMRMNYLRPEPQTLPSESEMESRLFGDLVPA